MRYELNYEILITTAPEEYDNFGAFTLTSWEQDDRTMRLVVCNTQHAQYHLGRYASGLYYASLASESEHASVLTENLINHNLSRRLMGLKFSF